MTNRINKRRNANIAICNKLFLIYIVGINK